MAKGLFSRIARALRAAWITGPIFGKELRVSGRRRRNYLLRFAYIALLALVVLVVWLAEVERYVSYGSAAVRATRMGEAGRIIIATVVWFQFCVTNLLAIVMLSTSIGGEIYDRTLGVLMTTPINSFQIVMGKLLSKLWQLLILVGISLPVLAVVRVFGGVPWRFVVAGVCITVVSLIHVGSVSMLLSVYSRRAYLVILGTLLVLGVVHALIPTILFAILEKGRPDRLIIQGIGYFSPYWALPVETEIMDSPGLALRRGGFNWPVHCAVLLGVSAAVLALCVRVVRRAALRQIAGDTRAGPSTSGRAALVPAPAAEGAEAGAPVLLPVGPAAAVSDPAEATGRVRPVVGSPVLWKELRTPLLRGRWRKILIYGGIVAAVLVTYLLCWSEHCLDDNDTQALYLFAFVCFGVLVTAVLAATAITSEKEARSWPLLVMTPLAAGQILLGKAAGVLRRCLPAWALLVGHLLLFTLAQHLHPVASLHLAMIASYVSVFLIGTGLYFSALLRRTTTAVVANLLLVIVLWGAVPVLAVLVWEVSRGYRDSPWLKLCIDANPGFQAGSAGAGAGGGSRPLADITRLRYEAPGNSKNVFEFTWLLLGSAAAHSLAGGLFAWRAAGRFRRHVFRK